MQTKTRWRGPAKLALVLVSLGLVVVLACQYLGNFFYNYWTAFTVQEQGYKADVVFLGPSHVFSSIIPQKLYDDKGIAACNVSAGSVGMANTYWAARETIDTMHPKLIYVELMKMVVEPDPENVNLIEEMPLTSHNRWRAMAATGANLSNWGEYVRFLFSHGELEDLSRTNFLYADYESTFAISLGYEQNETAGYYTAEQEFHYESTAPYTPVELPAENIKAYRDIAQYAAAHNVQVIWCLAPDPRPEFQDAYQTVVDLLAADGQTVYNANTDTVKQEMGFDIVTDMRDDHHLNYTGATKFTTWLETKLETYDLPDRRGTPGYELWEKYPYSYAQLHLENQLGGCNDLDTYLDMLSDLPASKYVVSVTGWGEWTMTDAQRIALQNGWTGTNFLPPDNVDFLLLSAGAEDITLTASDSSLAGAVAPTPIRRNVDGVAFSLADTPEGASVMIGQEEQLPSDNGLSLTVYSVISHRVVDSVRFAPDQPPVHG